MNRQTDRQTDLVVVSDVPSPSRVTSLLSVVSEGHHPGSDSERREQREERSVHQHRPETVQEIQCNSVNIAMKQSKYVHCVSTHASFMKSILC